jgi:hypothetical protein
MVDVAESDMVTEAPGSDATFEEDTFTEDAGQDLDGSVAEPDGIIDPGVDSGEVVEGSGEVSPLFTICATNADCPLPGTVCLKEFQLSHQSSGSDRTSFGAREVLGSLLPVGSRAGWLPVHVQPRQHRSRAGAAAQHACIELYSSGVCGPLAECGSL